MGTTYEVSLDRSVKKAIVKAKRVPKEVTAALLAWVAAVELVGLPEVRKIPGYHDEPLKGDRKGERSVRLNKQWRAIYVESAPSESKDGQQQIIVTVIVTEVTPHAY
jgi:proteic killer suppression protein